VTALDAPGGATDSGEPAIPASRFGERIDRARAALGAHGAAALLLGVGADLRYLAGYVAPALERLTMLVVTEDSAPVLVAPRLEAMAAAECPAAVTGRAEVVAWDETEDAYALVAQRLSQAGEGELMVSDTLWALHLLALQAALPGRRFGRATDVLRELRMTKDPEEVGLLRRAAHAADRALAGIAAGPLIGRTEAEISREIRDRLLDEGHEVAQFAIVASGPNSASPHHEAGVRRIEAGEPIVLDIGGSYRAYGSDMTRTIWVAGPNDVPPTDEFRAVYELVREANAAATASAREGVACEAIDAAARAVVTAGGHGAEFLHRVGHGIGLETHEDPYLVAGNGEPLGVGSAFSIEPGVYIAGRFGVRIEDIVVCGPDGPDVLNEAPRDLLVVAG
jgi:Xaa-Pro aminopeptidase